MNNNIPNEYIFIFILQILLWTIFNILLLPINSETVKYLRYSFACRNTTLWIGCYTFIIHGNNSVALVPQAQHLTRWCDESQMVTPVHIGGCTAGEKPQIMNLRTDIGAGTPAPTPSREREIIFYSECKQILSGRRGRSLPWKVHIWFWER